MRCSLLGCIADDFTGATDLASNLVAAGLRVVQTFGVPAQTLSSVDGPVDAVVVALKSRTIPAQEAVDQALSALAWLRAQGAAQIYFKYCSTFDSTSKGNIGPVTDALMDALGADFTIACPAFPENGRTVFKGHLFVGDLLLSDSGMRHHPLTPMTDANLLRVLQAQTHRRVGLIDWRTVSRGTNAISERIRALQVEGVQIAVIDAVSNDDLLAMGPALKPLKLITAGSGVAIGMGGYRRESEKVPSDPQLSAQGQAGRLPPAQGGRAIVSGSCSVATNGQVADYLLRGGAAFAVDPLRLASGEDLVTHALAWARDRLLQGPLLVYATAEPAAVQAAQNQLGVQRAGELVEEALAKIARGLVVLGVGQLVVAGGETSGACVQALSIDRMRIGPAIAPGVPWCYAEETAAGRSLHLTLKSGNFGAPDFFTTAFAHLA